MSIKLTRKTRGVFLRCPNTWVVDVYGGPLWVNGKRSRMASPGGGPQFHARHAGYIEYNEDGSEKDLGYEGDIPGTVVENCVFVCTGDDCIGVFEQTSPIVRNCRFFDSFARSIYDYRCTDIIREDNREFRCGYERDTEKP